MHESWAEHVQNWDQRSSGSEESSRRRPWSAMLGLTALLIGLCAFGIGLVAPNHETIVMIGPLQAGKVRVVLWSVAILLVVLAVLVWGSLAAYRASTWWAGLLATLLWLAAVAVTGVVLLVSLLVYDQQPETHRFTVDGQQYLLTSQIGFLIAADDTYLDLYRRDDLRYRNTGLRLTPADTVAFNNDSFTLERDGDRVRLVYRDAGGETERVRIH